MVLKKDIVFILLKHPFKGLMVKATCNGKAISPYTAGIPSDIRQILRNVLLHKDISSELPELLDKYHNDISLKLKLNHTILDCYWDNSISFEKKLTISSDNDIVTIFSEGKPDDVVLLSNEFCFFKKTSSIGRIIDDKIQSGLYLLAERSGYKSLKDIFDKPLDAEDFNQLSLFFESKQELNDVLFIYNKQKTVPIHIQPKLNINISYEDDNQIVTCAPFYEFEGSQFDIALHLFKNFAVIKKNQPNLNSKQRRSLIRLILRYSRSNDSVRFRIKDHFLPKIIPQNILKNFSEFISFNSKEKIYQVFLDNQKWVVTTMDYQKELCLWICLGSLFTNYIDPDESEVSLKLDKREFNSCLSLFQKICKELGCTITYQKREIVVTQKQLSMDISQMTQLDDIPIIKLNDDVLSYENLIELKSNLWSYIDNQQVHVLDESLINHFESILEVMEFQKKTLPANEEFPITRISHLLDWIQLRASGVSVKLSNQQEKQIASFFSFKSLNPVTVPNLNNAKPRQYQKEGLNWMMFLYTHQLGAVLADDMGLGKTFQSLMLLAAIKEENKNQAKNPHLIVVPPSLIYNWSHEIERFCPDFKVSIYAGPQRHIEEDVDVIITSYELLRRDYAKLSEVTFDIAIFDEAQFIKNHMSARTKAAQQIKRNFCLCLTGTPIENHVGEYITILNTILPGFFSYSKQLVSTITSQHVAMIIKRSKPFVLRRLKNQISHELKPKTEEDVFLTMSPAQEKIYQSLVAAIRKQVTGLKKHKEKSLAIFTALMRLRQACVSPYLIDETFNEITPKFSFLIEKLKVLRDEGHSVLVFSQFIKSLNIIEDLCKQESLSYYRLDGSVSAIKRKEAIDAFQSSKNPEVFLMSLKAGGVGLNLTKASYVFHLDPWWNPAVENQATDRVHRIGQEQRVFSYKLIMHNSIEEKIQEIKEKKAALFNMMLDDSDIVKRSDVLTADDFLWLLES